MKLSSTLLILGSSMCIFGIIVIFLNWFSSGSLDSIQVPAIWTALIGFIMIVGISILRRHIDRRSIHVGKKLSLVRKAALIIGVCIIVASFFLNQIYAELFVLPNLTPEMRVFLGNLTTVTPIIFGIGIGLVLFGVAIFFIYRKRDPDDEDSQE